MISATPEISERSSGQQIGMDFIQLSRLMKQQICTIQKRSALQWGLSDGSMYFTRTLQDISVHRQWYMVLSLMEKIFTACRLKAVGSSLSAMSQMAYQLLLRNTFT